MKLRKLTNYSLTKREERRAPTPLNSFSKPVLAEETAQRKRPERGDRARGNGLRLDLLAHVNRQGKCLVRVCYVKAIVSTLPRKYPPD